MHYQAPKCVVSSESTTLKDYDLVVLPCRVKGKSPSQPELPSHWPKAMRDCLEEALTRYKDGLASGGAVAIWLDSQSCVLLFGWDPHANCFETLSALRSAFKKLEGPQWQKVLLDLRHLDGDLSTLVDASASVITVMNFKKRKFLKAPDSKEGFLWSKISVAVQDAAVEGTRKQMRRAQILSEATNRVRDLVNRPANDLSTRALVAEVQDHAKQLKLKCKVYNFAELKKIGAGAFVAVAQGSAHKDAAIVKLSYRPATKSASKRIHACLVGKGITYDTGGINLKPARYMFGMQGDMAGAAVAFAVLEAAVRLKMDMDIDCYLAIADNAIGPDSYHPNQVVKSLSGKTIEVVHTDAEGRMALSDTLTLASRDKPDVIVDFATLTGACVGAISNRYAGVFSDHPHAFEKIIEAGKDSGERAWPFPMDKDFAESLKSDVADLKQCRLTGGVDHIEAALFLRNFIEGDPIWAHVDLSAAECEGGLAHVEDSFTGFGARLGMELMLKLAGFVGKNAKGVRKS